MVSDTQTSTRPPRRRSALKTTGLILLVLFLLLALLLFWLFGTNSGTRAALSGISSLTGGSIQAEGVSGRLSDRVQIDKLVIDNPGQTLTLSEIDMLWRPTELLQRRLHIRQLQVAHVSLNQKEQPDEEPARLPDSISAPLQLQIDGAKIGSGEVRNADVILLQLEELAFNLRYDGRQYVFNLDGMGLQTTQQDNEFAGDIKGSLTLSDTQPYAIEGRFSSSGEGQVADQAVGAQGQISLDGSLADLTTRADLTINRTQVKGHVQLRPFSESVLGEANLAIRALDLASVSPDLPITRLDIDLHAKADGAGKLEISNRDAGLLNNKRIPLTGLSLAFEHGPQRLRFRDLQAVLGDGSQAAGTVTGNGMYQEGRLDVSLRSERLNLQRLDERLRATRLSGTVEMRHSEGKQALTVNLSEPLDRNRLTLVAQAELAGQLLTIMKAELRLAGGAALFSGSMQLDGKQAFEAEGQLQRFKPSDIGNFAQLPDLLLNGRFTLQGEREPQLAGELKFDLKDSRIAGHPLRGSGEARLRGDSITVPNLALFAGANRVQMQGALSERNSRLSFVIDAPQLHQLSPQFGGALQAQGNASGTLDTPHLYVEWQAAKLRLPEDIQLGSVQGQADIRMDRSQPFSLRQLSATLQAASLRTGAQSVESLNAKLQFSPRANAPLQLDIAAKAVDLGAIRADTMNLRGDGTTGKHTLRASGTDGKQQWEAQASGGLNNWNTAPRWQGSVEQLLAQGTFGARLRNPAPLSASAQETRLEDFFLDTDTGLVAVERFERNARGMSTRGRIERLQLAQLLRFAAEEPPLRTDLELSGTWNLSMGKTLSGNMSFRRERGDVVMLAQTPIALGLRTLELNADAKGNELLIHMLAEGEQLGHIALDAKAYGRGSQLQFGPATQMAGDIRVNVPDLGWVGPLVSPALIAGGRLESRIKLGGTLSEPRLDGQILGNALRLFFADTGVDLRQGTLIGRFDDSRLLIETLRFAQDDGHIAVSGPIRFTDGQPDVQLALQAQRYRVLNRADRRLTLSGDSRITVRAGEATVTGKFNVNSGFFDIGRADMPSLSNDVVIIGQEEKQAASFPLALDLQIGLGDGITLRGRGLDTIVVGEVRLLNGAGDTIQAQGTLRLAKGTFTAYGRELAIERGVLQFSGPVDNPGLNILAMRREQEVAAGVSVGGTVLAPRVTLVSEPPLPDAEKLSWLVFGRGLEAVGQGDLAVLQAAAGALLGGRESAGMQSQLTSALGLDTLSLTTSEDGLQERIVTVGKQLSSRLYVSYRQGLENLTSVLLLRYELSRRLTLEAEAGSRSAISVFYNIAFD